MSRPLRSLYSFPHAIGAAGIGITALHQVRGLAAAGVQVTLVCTSVEAPLPAGVRVVETLKAFGRRIPHRVLGSAQRAYDYHDWRVARLVAASDPAPDVVHVWPRGCLRTINAAAGRGAISVREAPNAHTAAVFDDSQRAAREAGVELPAGHSHQADARVLSREEAEFACCDYLLSPSDFVRRSFETRGYPTEKLIDTQYGYAPERFIPAPRTPGQEPFTALFLGRADPTKGMHLALQAWIRSGVGATGRLLVCGRLDDAFAATLGSDLHAPGVDLLGFVDRPEEQLRQADVLLLPTYTEGSALVTYEAIGSGCVPLVSTAAGAPIVDGVTGLLHDVGDVRSLAGQLTRLAADPERLGELRRGCLEHRDRWTWDAAGQRLADGYRMAVARGANAQRPARASR